MSDDQVGCEWVSVSSGTGLPWLSRTKAIKRVCVCVCVRACVRVCARASYGDQPFIFVSPVTQTGQMCCIA